MPEEKWTEIEYLSLRQELFNLIEIGQATVRFCLPASAAVYAVPVLLQRPSDVYLWCVCAGLAGLLLTAMVFTFCGCVEGARRIGAYIKEVIEPATNHGLKWETILWNLERQRAEPSIPAILVVAAGAFVANVGAAAASGMIFLDGQDVMFPPAVAGLFVFIGMPIALRTSRPSRRQLHTSEIRAILDSELTLVARVNETSDDHAKTKAVIPISAAPGASGVGATETQKTVD